MFISFLLFCNPYSFFFVYLFSGSSIKDCENVNLKLSGNKLKEVGEMKRFAFLLSAEEYMIYPETAFCHNDNDLLKHNLIDFCDYAEQDVTNIKLTIFDETTPKIVLEELEKLVERTEPGDTILFYFAGHGITEDGDSYLVLPHTDHNNIKQTALPLRDISSLLRKPGRINLRIYDACHSGQDVRSADTEVPNSKQFTENLLLQQPNEESYITLASCKENEYSYPDSNLKNGVFTYFLCESLKEFHEEENVFPEILKMKLCDKVKNWCDINGKIQTPTMNSSISGNVAIAKRKKTEVLKPGPQVKEKEESTANLLTLLRSAAVIEETKQKEYLSEYINIVWSYLKEHSTKIQAFDCDVRLCQQPMDVSYIDHDIKENIVKFIVGKRFKPRHEIKIQKIYEKKRPKTLWEKQIIGLLGQKESEPEIKEIIYDILETDWPESFVEIQIMGDKVMVPEVSLFFYLLPLQMTACLIGGYRISYEGDSVIRFNKDKVLKYEADSNLIPSLIDEIISLLNIEADKLIRKRIKYLQWEISL